ncbi:MAG: hypothetical protein GY754_37635 [bacterium]|nr:hypothetical protein [bacterium]
MLFFVKVRIDLEKMPELGRKLADGSLDMSMVRMTYCIENDPSVGLNIWEAPSRESFEKAFAPHKEFYKEVMEITPVISPDEAKRILMEQLQG